MVEQIGLPAAFEQEYYLPFLTEVLDKGFTDKQDILDFSANHFEERLRLRDLDRLNNPPPPKVMPAGSKSWDDYGIPDYSYEDYIEFFSDALIDTGQEGIDAPSVQMHDAEQLDVPAKKDLPAEDRKILVPALENFQLKEGLPKGEDKPKPILPMQEDFQMKQDSPVLEEGLPIGEDKAKPILPIQDDLQRKQGAPGLDDALKQIGVKQDDFQMKPVLEEGLPIQEDKPKPILHKQEDFQMKQGSPVLDDALKPILLPKQDDFQIEQGLPREDMKFPMVQLDDKRGSPNAEDLDYQEQIHEFANLLPDYINVIIGLMENLGDEVKSETLDEQLKEQLFINELNSLLKEQKNAKKQSLKAEISGQRCPCCNAMKDTIPIVQEATLKLKDIKNIMPQLLLEKALEDETKYSCPVCSHKEDTQDKTVATTEKPQFDVKISPNLLQNTQQDNTMSCPIEDKIAETLEEEIAQAFAEGIVQAIGEEMAQSPKKEIAQALDGEMKQALQEEITEAILDDKRVEELKPPDISIPLQAKIEPQHNILPDINAWPDKTRIILTTHPEKLFHADVPEARIFGSVIRSPTGKVSYEAISRLPSPHPIAVSGSGNVLYEKMIHPLYSDSAQLGSGRDKLDELLRLLTEGSEGGYRNLVTEPQPTDLRPQPSFMFYPLNSEDELLKELMQAFITPPKPKRKIKKSRSSGLDGPFHATEKLRAKIERLKESQRGQNMELQPQSNARFTHKLEERTGVPVTGRSWLRTFLFSKTIERICEEDWRKMYAKNLDVDLGEPVWMLLVENPVSNPSVFSSMLNIIGAFRSWYFTRRLRAYQKKLDNKEEHFFH